MFAQSFMVQALLAGTATAAAAGLAGYFLVLRAQVFTGDALSHVAFTGAMGALLAGVGLRAGLFGATVAVAVVLGLLGRRGRADDVTTGAVFALTLGVGALFLSQYARRRATGNSTAGVHVLFGSIFGISAPQARTTAVLCAVVILALLLLARPLLFATLDEVVAASCGLPTRGLGVVFLALVALVVAQAVQVVGSLMLLALLAAPAGAVALLPISPWLAMALSATTAVTGVWAGLAVSFLCPTLPPSFTIVTALSILHITLRLAAAANRSQLTRRARRSPASPVPGTASNLTG